MTTCEPLRYRLARDSCSFDELTLYRQAEWKPFLHVVQSSFGSLYEPAAGPIMLHNGQDWNVDNAKEIHTNNI